MNEQVTKAVLFAALQALGEVIPEMRGGQLMAAVGELCARLENLTKDHDCAVIVSRRAAEVAGLDVKSRKLHRASVEGRMQTVEFYALKTLADLRV